MPDKYKMTPDERDLLIRTLIGEAGDQGDDGMAAVAHVVMNRLRSGRHGSDIPGVVLAPKQFEPWQTRPRELMAIDPKSKPYQRAASVVDQVAGGYIPDPTSGATHFLDEGIVRRRRGGSLPPWANGNGLKIGDHTFYAPEGRALPYAPTDVAGDPGERADGQRPGRTPRLAQAGGVTSDDIAETLRQFGLSPAAVAPGVLDRAPGAPSPADIEETLRQAGISMSGTASPIPKPPGMPEPVPGKLGPELQAEAERRSKDLGPLSTITEGVPFAGPATRAAAAATGAAFPQTGSVPGASFGERFPGNLSILDEAQDLYNKRNPMTSLTGNILGSTALTGLGAMTAPGRFALGLSGPSLASKVYQGAVGNAVINTGDALAHGENPLSALTIGAGGGAAGPLVARGVEGLMRGMQRAAPVRSGPLAGTSSIARDHVINALEGETPASLTAARERMGPAGFFGDINTATTDLTGGMADIPGPQKGMIREAYRQRAKAQPDRIDQALTAAIGPSHDIEAFKNFTTEARKAAADPLYNQWRSMKVTPTPKLLDDIMPRLEKAGAFKMGEELAGISGHPMNALAFTKNNNVTNYPTTESWDYAKRGLDRRIDQAYTAGDKTLARELINLKHDMLNEIENTPAGHVWKQARQEFASRSAILDQIEAGKDTFLGGRSGTSVDELRHELKGLSGPELSARMQGLRSAMDETMGATTRGDTTLRNKILAPNNQKKLEFMLGKDKAEALIKTMKQEEYLGQQRDNIVGGSQTTPKRERIDALMPPPSRPMNFNITQPATWVPHGMLPQSVADAWRGQRHANALSQLAPLALTPSGPELDRLLAATSKESLRRSLRSPGINALSGVLSGAISGPTTSTARRQYFPTQ